MASLVPAAASRQAVHHMCLPLRGAAWLVAAALLSLAVSSPAQAQRCTNQNGQTICCDNSGNCYTK
jgi:hypothetical protein